MPEPVERWWSRRQWSKKSLVPYAIGTYRVDWARYPVLIRQYHPDLNGGITLTQIPPAADVYLVWVCESGHRFVATPDEQRGRPGRVRRRSSWCPECAELAAPRRKASDRPRVTTASEGSRAQRRPYAGSSRSAGDAFISPHAPKATSAAEADLRRRLADRLSVDCRCTAIAVREPFFDRLEVWPDIILSELRVAVEYDTTGRHGLEHVGKREAIDRRKDRLLRAAGWEVIRIRCGKLEPIGPFDLQASGVTAAVVDRLIERLCEIRGELIVRAYTLT